MRQSAPNASSHTSASSLSLVALFPLFWGLQNFLLGAFREARYLSGEFFVFRDSKVQLILMHCGISMWTVVEALLLLLLLRGFSLRGRGVVSGAVRVLSLSAVFLSMVFFIGSWTLFLQRDVFLSWQDLSAAHHLLSVSELDENTTHFELLLAFAGLCGAIALTLVVDRATKNLSPALLKSYLKSVFVGFLFLVITLSTVRQNILHNASVILRNFATPQLHLLSSAYDSIVDSEELNDQSVGEPIESLSEYSARAAQVGGLTARNIIMISVEALRYDVIGKKVDGKEITPTLNQLIRDGAVSVPRLYAHAPESTYSAVSMLTGQHPLRFRVRDVYDDLSYPHALVYDLLSEAGGYRTGFFFREWEFTRKVTESSHLDLNIDTEALSKHAHIELESHTDTLLHDAKITEEFTRWASESERPFFAAMYYFGSHFPYSFPPESRVFSKVDGELGGGFLGYHESLREEYKLRYFDSLRQVDSRVAELLRELQESGQLENTVLMVTGDHGELFGEHGAVTHTTNLWEEVLHVPLIIAGLTEQQASSVSRWGGHMDLVPTILEIVGLPHYRGLQGDSLLGADGDSCPRAQFSSVQMIEYEDSVVVGNFRFSINHKQGEERFTRVLGFGEQRVETSELIQSVKLSELRNSFVKLLKDFRVRQLSYYADKPRWRRHFPPSLPQTEEYFTTRQCEYLKQNHSKLRH